jgi:formylglycine-generating enzyme required for sulfatase activity/serine/threonine protein kinase
MKECPACRRCFPDDINHCPQDGDATTPSLLGEPILDARYQLERRLGQGGMGVVFQARHIFLKTSHAIKVILPDLVGNDPMLVTRFRQEALAAAAIRHQNIIAVTDFGVVRGTMPFLVMEFVAGRSLHDILADEGVMGPRRALDIIGAVAAGVGAAHKQNIVHRDLKPLNIMIQNGMSISEGLKILDFGLAKIKSGELLGSFVQAKTSGLMGSPFYMAPEQWSDEEPDTRADIYSLGIILYQMLCGDVPFKGSSIPSIMKKHLTLPVPSFQSLGVNAPPALEAAVRHALEKEIESRTPSVEAFLAELSHALDNSNAPVVTAARDTGSIDFNRTVASSFTSTGVTPPAEETGFGASFDSMAGTVSAASLDTDVAAQVASVNERMKREQEDRERVARDELAREADYKRKVLEEADKRRQEEDRVRKEKEDREEKERLQREQIERVTRQAKELEERLERLATSMPPKAAAVIDPEVTQVHQNIAPQAVGDNSYPRAQAVEAARPAVVVEVPQRKSGSKTPIIIAAVVLFVILVSAVGGYIYLRPKEVVGPGKGNNNGNGGPSPPPTQIKADSVEIPGGSFRMGRNGGPPQESPVHEVKVQSFLMDKTEVTKAEYAEFVRETNYAPPSDWGGSKPPYGQELWPVINVSWEDANNFAQWRSKRDGVSYRLPTEEEWEYAARNGDRSDLYPWGGEWQDQRAVLLGAGTPAPVGSHPAGSNRWGVQDLIGNVWEWTSSKVSAYPGNPVEIPEATRDWMAIRGGGFNTNPADKENPVSSCLRSFITPKNRNNQLGFRLVRSRS